MPIYEYRAEKGGCPHCSKSFELLQKKTDPEETACPKCGASCHRILSVFSVGGSSSQAAFEGCGAGACGVGMSGSCGDMGPSPMGGCGAGSCGI